MDVHRGKILLISDGPGVMVHTAPLILALQAAEMDVSLAVTPSAGVFATPFSPAMLTGHPMVSWPPADGLPGFGVVLAAPCSVGFFRSISSGDLGRSLAASGAKLLVAPACLEGEDAEAALAEFASAGGGKWTVVPDCGNRIGVGALGAIHLASPELCVEAVRRALSKQVLSGVRVLITAGPTAEDIDPVRYITNRSTGRMGVSLAKIAARFGAEVTLVHGPMSWPVPAFPGIHPVPVRSAGQMHEAVMSAISSQDMAILCAAVADFTPESYSDMKIKKRGGALSALALKRTPDILASIGALPSRPFLVGFAAESDHVETNALDKLSGKHCDMLCANDITEPGSGFAVGTNRVTVFLKDGRVERLPQMSKDDVARKVLELASSAMRGQRG